MGESTAVTPLPRMVIVVVAAAGFAVSMNLTMMNVTFEALRESFPDTSSAGLSWVITGYSTVSAALLLASGRVADLFGRRRVFFVGLGLFALGSTAAGLSPTPSMIIASRVVEGLGAALVTPSAIALLVTAVAPERRATAIGVWGSIVSFSAALGPAVGSLLIEVSTWRLVFFAHAPMTLMAVVLGRRFLVESRHPETSGLPDPVGIAASALAIGAMALILVQSNDWTWNDPRLLGSIGLGLAAALTFVLRSRRHPRPVLDLALFRKRSFSSAVLISVLYGTAFSALIFANVLFLRRVWGYSFVQAGFGIAPSPICSAITANIGGRVADRIGVRQVIVPGIALVVCGLAWLIFAVPIEPAYVLRWLPGTLLFGGGTGLVFANLSTAAVADMEPGDLGVASAANNTGRIIGNVLGPAFVVASVGTATGALAAPDFDRTYGVLAGVGLAALAIAVFVLPKDTGRRPSA